MLSPKEQVIVNDIIADNIKATEKSGMPLL